MDLLIKTLAGLEPVLAEELTELGAQEVTLLKRAVRCSGAQELLYRANLELRTAIRVLIPQRQFEVASEQDWYDYLREIDWSTYLNLQQTFAIDVVTQSAQLNHSHYLALKAKDAIVDWFRENNRGKRPSIDTKNPAIRFHLHLDSLNQASFLLDSSGDGLHRRGYRTGGGMAPLNEVLAAGMLRLAEWRPDLPLVDFMCGSGTILIEAGQWAARIAPGLRRRFAFQNWSDYNADLWQELLAAARDRQQAIEVPIEGVDKHFKAFRVAEQNIAAAGLEGQISVRRMSFERFTPSQAGRGMLIINPPYGLRVEEEAAMPALYQAIGDKLKQDFTGYTAWILSGNAAALKHVGLRTSRKIALMNGQLECKFQRYDLYVGSKKS
jgi:putative N6-adenine-specific DNA methylase